MNCIEEVESILVANKNVWFQFTGAPEFLCHLCGVTKHTAACLRVHMRTHEAPQYKCTKCGAEFRKLVSLRSHIARHVDPSPVPTYQCHVCEKVYSSKKTLRIHVLCKCFRLLINCSSQPNEEVIWSGLSATLEPIDNKCVIFWTDKHIRTSEDRKFACEICSEKFFNRPKMQSHLQTVHTTDRGLFLRVTFFKLPANI